MAITVTSKKAAFISQIVDAAETMLSAYQKLKTAQAQNDDLAFFTQGSAYKLVDSDFDGGNNEHLDFATFQQATVRSVLELITQIEATRNTNAFDIRENLRILART